MIAPSFQPQTVKANCEPLGRFAFGLTPRAIGLFAAGLLLALPGFFDARLGYAMLAWDALVAFVLLWDFQRLPAARDIVLERSWANAPAQECETELELAVLQAGTTVLDCRLIDDLPESLVAQPVTSFLQAYPNVRSSVRYRIVPRERGDAQPGYLYIHYTSTLGLVERRAKAALTQRVRVYPGLRQSDNQKLFLARARQIDIQLRRMRQRGMGRDFESLRDYRQGDDLRDVCWTATARRGLLITRQYETERSQAVWIVIDAGRLMQGRVTDGPVAGSQAGDEGQSKLDLACATAVALAQLALYAGDRVGLLVYGQSIQQRILPARGSTHLHNLIEALAMVRAESSEADHLRATATLSRLQPQRSLILWVTDLAETAMRPEVVDGAFQLLQRHVLLFVAMAQPDIQAIAGEFPRNVPQMFRASAAQELASRRELLLARLRERGALTLDQDPHKLLAEVLNQYLKVKERAMI